MAMMNPQAGYRAPQGQQPPQQPPADGGAPEQATTTIEIVHAAVVAARQGEVSAAFVRTVLQNSPVFALGPTSLLAEQKDGRPTQVRPTAQRGIDLLHLEVDGEEMIPVWTSLLDLQATLQVQPSWADLALVLVDGKGILTGPKPVSIVFNPWSQHEWQLQPTD